MKHRRPQCTERTLCHAWLLACPEQHTQEEGIYVSCTPCTHCEAHVSTNWIYLTCLYDPIQTLLLPEKLVLISSQSPYPKSLYRHARSLASFVTKHAVLSEEPVEVGLRQPGTPRTQRGKHGDYTYRVKPLPLRASYTIYPAFLFRPPLCALRPTQQQQQYSVLLPGFHALLSLSTVST